MRCGVGSIASEYGPAVGSCVHGEGPQSFTRGRKHPYQLGDYEVLKDCTKELLQCSVPRIH
jgi:hypothetical protein